LIGNYVALGGSRTFNFCRSLVTCVFTVVSLMNSSRPEQLINAVKTVAAGDALLSPAVTRNVIAHFTRQRRQASPRAVETLTPRELNVFRLIAQGKSNAEIGRELFISDTTVKTHVTRLLQKLNVRDRAQAIVVAYQCNLFEP
jgi:DNA-binding NarL/FixJ family response regulator